MGDRRGFDALAASPEPGLDSEWPDSVSRDNVRAESFMAEFFMAFSAKDANAIQASGTVDPTEVFPGSQLVYLKRTP